MGVEEDSIDPADVERAKAFWEKRDVDKVFNTVLGHLNHLKMVLKKNTATDKEYVQGLKLLESLDCCPPASAQDSVVQVVIGTGGFLLPDISQPSPSCSPSSSPLPPSNGSPGSAAPPAGREELLPSLSPVHLQFLPHSCCEACLSTLPSMPQSLPLFWGQNPLKIPLLCGFKRLTARPLMSPGVGGVTDDEGAEPDIPEEGAEDWGVVYKAPCGLSLCSYEDVMCFLWATGSYDILRVDFFTFNTSVRLDPPRSIGPQRPELDLSRGAEPTPVELCPGDAGARPPDFRYRKDRWPHGCFLSRCPTLFSACCDCPDGCSDAQRCACVAMTRGGRHYSHHRLDEPVPSGVYECGPWCGCDRARCQNRLVQRGIRVRLQVFQTDGRGWGVRCRDDLDRGTFVCVYAGVILQRVQCPAGPPSPKLSRTELPSDDEVEVVTEWLAPPVKEGRSNVLESTSSPTHVPVIQRPADANSKTSTLQDRGKAASAGGPQPASPASGDETAAQEKTAAATESSPEAAAVHGVNGAKTERKRLKRAMTVEDINFLDASKEGNVGRFINHSCQPNLFLQNVFTDSHDPSFPVIAFFTSRVVKAGAELTWNYSADTLRKREVPCLCGGGGCHGHFSIEESLCDVCEADGETR